MQHPLRFVPDTYRQRIFFALVILTLILFAVFWVLDQPLQTPAAPNGIISFELAGNASTARAITDSWKELSLLLSSVAGQSNPDIVNIPYVFAAFGLGLDYLFMPIYALTLSFGTLLAAGRQAGWIKSLGALAGYGAFAAAMFDAVENYALLQMLLNRIYPPYPELAYYAAFLKFVLILFGALYTLGGLLFPKRSPPRYVART